MSSKLVSPTICEFDSHSVTHTQSIDLDIMSDIIASETIMSEFSSHWAKRGREGTSLE